MLISRGISQNFVLKLIGLLILVVNIVLFFLIFSEWGRESEQALDLPDRKFASYTVYYKIENSEPVVIEVDQDVIADLESNIEPAIVFDGTFGDLDKLITDCIFGRVEFGCEHIKLGSVELVDFTSKMPIFAYSVRTRDDAKNGVITTIELAQSSYYFPVDKDGFQTLENRIWNGLAVEDDLSLANPYLPARWQDSRAYVLLRRSEEKELSIYFEFNTGEE